ncbi:MAG: hypothetical protein WBF18_09295 [Solirubrobacterales bacterium]
MGEKQRSRGKVKPAVAGLAALIAAGGASEALAGGGIKTTAKLESVKPEGAKGKVSSKKSKCVRGRKVTLFFDLSKSGVTDPNAKDPKIGTDKTNKKGKFEIEQPLSAGTYYVKVAAKKAGKRKCRAAKSKSKKG